MSNVRRQEMEERRELRALFRRNLAERFERLVRECSKSEAARRLGVDVKTAELALKVVKGGQR